VITLLLVIISLISLIAFRYPRLQDKLALSPYLIHKDGEYYRMFTNAFIHADYIHLGVNMIVLWSFGNSVEAIFKNLESYEYIRFPYLHLSILIILSILGSILSTIRKFRNNPEYSAVGASGMVSAIVFTHIFFQPMEKIYFYFAIPIPGIVFGILYLIYSSYMGRRKRDNINHDAHLWGAIIGFLYPLLMNPKLIKHFLESLGIQLFTG